MITNLLDEVESSLVDGRFSEALDTLRSEPIGTWEQAGKKLGRDMNSLRTCCWAAELLDYAGLYKQVEAILKTVGPECDALLKKRRPLKSKSDAGLLKQQIWTTIHWGYVHYRKGNLQEALQILSRCEDAAKALESHGHAARGTLARIYYSKGLIFREQFNHSAAKASFTYGVGYAWDHLMGHAESEENAYRKMLREFDIAKALGLGLAWVHYSEGNLELSIPLLLSSKALISRYKNEELIRSYIDVVYAGVMRSRWGDHKQTLESAITSLTLSYRTFVRLKHSYYRLRSAYNLALAHIQAGRIASNDEARQRAFGKALDYIGEMREGGNFRLSCAADIFESRISRDRREYKAAEDLATTALGVGRTEKDNFTIVNALIARGEVRLLRGNRSGSIEDFKAAQGIPAVAPHIIGIARLHLSRAYIEDGDLRNASDAWRGWQQMHIAPENSFVKNLEQEVRQRLEGERQDFVIPFDRRLDRKEEELRFHKFLINWARHRTKTDTAAIKALGISRQTFYKWLKETGSPRLPKRQKGQSATRRKAHK